MAKETTPTETPLDAPDNFTADLFASAEKVESEAERVRDMDAPEQPAEPDSTPEANIEGALGVVKDMLHSGDLSEDVLITDLPHDVLMSDNDSIRSHLSGIETERRQQAEAAKLEEVLEESDADQLEERSYAVEDAMMTLETGSAQEAWDAAEELTEHGREAITPFLQQWHDVDPEAAQLWVRLNPPEEWPEPKTGRDHLREAEYLVSERARIEKQDAVMEALKERVAELEQDPRAAKAMPTALDLLSELIAENQAAAQSWTPEEAKQAVDDAVKGTDAFGRESIAARQDARLLADMDRRLHERAYLSGETDLEPRRFTKADYRAAAERELFNSERAERVAGREPGTATRSLLDNFDRGAQSRATPEDPEWEKALTRMAKERADKVASKRRRNVYG